jgi:hypothetical protein
MLQGEINPGTGMEFRLQGCHIFNISSPYVPPCRRTSGSRHLDARFPYTSLEWSRKRIALFDQILKFVASLEHPIRGELKNAMALVIPHYYPTAVRRLLPINREFQLIETQTV